MNTNYIINDCGVCINPTVIYRLQKKNALAWNYVEITYAQFPNGKWDYGYSTVGGGASPCEVRAKFSTKEEVVLGAKQYLKEHLEKRIKNYESGFMVSIHDYQYYLNEFLSFIKGEQQLSLF